MNSKTKTIVTASLLAALTCIATMIIKIPSPLKGYINLGDCIVLFSGAVLSPLYAFLAAGIGSALADIFSGYVIYAPATFIIKGVMAIIFCYSFKFFRKSFPSVVSVIISGAVAETFMVLGYFIFEGFLYGFVPSLINIPANAMQGIAGIAISLILINAFEKKKN